MPNIAIALRQEIARLARKEARKDSDDLRKLIAQQRSTLASLRKRVGTLEGQLKKLGRKGSGPARTEEVGAEQPRLRFRPAGFATLRQKLGLSAKSMGVLVGVSPLTIYKWENGGSRPRAKQLSAIAAVQHLGKREAQAQLELAASQASAAKKPRPRGNNK